MEPLGSIGSISPKAAGSSHPTASAGRTVMLLSAKLREKLSGGQCSGCSGCSGCSAPSSCQQHRAQGKERAGSPRAGPWHHRTAGGQLALPACSQLGAALLGSAGPGWGLTAGSGRRPAERVKGWGKEEMGAGSHPAERAQRMGLRGHGGVQMF